MSVADGAESLAGGFDAGSPVEFSSLSYFHLVDKKFERGLRDASASIPAGSKCVVVGGSRSGKSTLMKLLAHVYLPYSGTVSTDPSGVSYYDETSMLVDASVADNISYGLDISPNRLEWAARTAGVYAEIAELPRRFETRIESRDYDGSYFYRENGNERKLPADVCDRISIARTLARDQKIIIFDNPFKNQSIEKIEEISLNLGRLQRNNGSNVCVIVASATVAPFLKNFNFAVVLAEQTVTEYGPISEILNRNGPFAEIVKEQTGISSVAPMNSPSTLGEITVELLETAYPFCMFEPSALRYLCGCFHIRTFNLGQSLIKQGEQIDGVYFLVDGIVRETQPILRDVESGGTQTGAQFGEKFKFNGSPPNPDTDPETSRLHYSGSVFFGTSFVGGEGRGETWRGHGGTVMSPTTLTCRAHSRVAFIPSSIVMSAAVTSGIEELNRQLEKSVGFEVLNRHWIFHGLSKQLCAIVASSFVPIIVRDGDGIAPKDNRTMLFVGSREVVVANRVEGGGPDITLAPATIFGETQMLRIEQKFTHILPGRAAENHFTDQKLGIRSYDEKPMEFEPGRANVALSQLGWSARIQTQIAFDPKGTNSHPTAAPPKSAVSLKSVGSRPCVVFTLDWFAFSALLKNKDIRGILNSNIESAMSVLSVETLASNWLLSAFCPFNPYPNSTLVLDTHLAGDIRGDGLEIFATDTTGEKGNRRISFPPRISFDPTKFYLDSELQEFAMLLSFFRLKYFERETVLVNTSGPAAISGGGGVGGWSGRAGAAGWGRSSTQFDSSFGSNTTPFGSFPAPSATFPPPPPTAFSFKSKSLAPPAPPASTEQRQGPQMRRAGASAELYLVLAGVVNVRMTLADGSQFCSTVTRGQCFNEVSLISDISSRAGSPFPPQIYAEVLQATCSTDCLLLVLSSPDLEPLYQTLSSLLDPSSSSLSPPTQSPFAVALRHFEIRANALTMERLSAIASASNVILTSTIQKALPTIAGVYFSPPFRRVVRRPQEIEIYLAAESTEKSQWKYSHDSLQASQSGGPVRSTFSLSLSNLPPADGGSSHQFYPIDDPKIGCLLLEGQLNLLAIDPHRNFSWLKNIRGRLVRHVIRLSGDEVSERDRAGVWGATLSPEAFLEIGPRPVPNRKNNFGNSAANICENAVSKSGALVLKMVLSALDLPYLYERGVRIDDEIRRHVANTEKIHKIKLEIVEIRSEIEIAGADSPTDLNLPDNLHRLEEKYLEVQEEVRAHRAVVANIVHSIRQLSAVASLLAHTAPLEKSHYEFAIQNVLRRINDVPASALETSNELSSPVSSAGSKRSWVSQKSRPALTPLPALHPNLLFKKSQMGDLVGARDAVAAEIALRYTHIESSLKGEWETLGAGRSQREQARNILSIAKLQIANFSTMEKINLDLNIPVKLLSLVSGNESELRVLGSNLFSQLQDLWQKVPVSVSRRKEFLNFDRRRPTAESVSKLIQEVQTLKDAQSWIEMAGVRTHAELLVADLYELNDLRLHPSHRKPFAFHLENCKTCKSRIGFESLSDFMRDADGGMEALQKILKDDCENYTRVTGVQIMWLGAPVLELLWQKNWSQGQK